MENRAAVDQYWHAACRELGLSTQETYHDAYSFGDNETLANEILDLIKAGKKTTSAGLVEEYKHHGWPLPSKGDRIVVLSGSQEPACVIEYTSIEYIPFNEMLDLQFAQDEAEGFDTLDIWRDTHERYFSRVMERVGTKFLSSMQVVKMRFKVIYSKS